jgi:hypothetical protein
MPKNLTPEHLRCTWGGCPSVHRLDDGQLLIVGKMASDEEILKAGAVVGLDERALTIGAEYLAGLGDGN